MILGLIPARGGSKGVPKKNIRLVAGKPLIAYAIACGRACPALDRLVVSTDSEEIAAVARQYGADVPFLRPVELAADTTPMLPVLQHAINAVEAKYGEMVDLLVLIDPTAPLRRPEDIEGAIALIKSPGCEAVISGSIAHRNPYFNMVREEDGYVKLVCSSTTPIGRRQDAPVVYDLNTVVWAWSRQALMVESARIPQRTKLYCIPPERSIDLDNEMDFQMLEFLLQRNNK